MHEFGHDNGARDRHNLLAPRRHSAALVQRAPLIKIHIDLVQLASRSVQVGALGTNRASCQAALDVLAVNRLLLY